MGKLRDQLVASAHEKTDYFYHVLGKGRPTSDDLRKLTKGKTIALPKPFNRTVEGITEALIKKHVMLALERRSSWSLRVNTEMLLRFNTGDSANAQTNPMRGCPDVLAIIDGVFFGIEIKKPGGRLSGAQYTHLLKIHSSANCFGCIVCTKSGIEDLLEGQAPKGFVNQVPVF